MAEKHNEHGIEGRERIVKTSQKHGGWMDSERKRIVAAEYLTYIGEAKEWMEGCLKEELPPITELEKKLRNGVILAKLARFFSPTTVKKIHDEQQTEQLNLRHSDNFNVFIEACRQIGFPETYYFVLTDLYDMKNMPKVVYMIHALSHYLTRLGLAPKMLDLTGKLFFTDEQLEFTAKNLDNIQMPAFKSIGESMQKEVVPVSSGNNADDQMYQMQALSLVQWINSSTAALQANNFDAINEQVLIDLTKDWEKFNSDKIVREDRKNALLQQYTAIIRQNGEYTCPPELLPAAIEDAWAAMLVVASKRERALQLIKKSAQYYEQWDSLIQWIETAKTKNELSNPSQLASGDVERTLTEFHQYRSEKDNRRREQEELVRLFEAIRKEQQDLDLVFEPLQQRQVEDLVRNFAALDLVDSQHEAILTKTLDQTRRREAYEKNVFEVSQWITRKREEYEEQVRVGVQPERARELLEAEQVLQASKRREVEELRVEFAALQQEFGYVPQDKAANQVFEQFEQLEISAQGLMETLTQKASNDSAVRRGEAYERIVFELIEWIARTTEQYEHKEFSLDVERTREMLDSELALRESKRREYDELIQSFDVKQLVGVPSPDEIHEKFEQLELVAQGRMAAFGNMVLAFEQWQISAFELIKFIAQTKQAYEPREFDSLDEALQFISQVKEDQSQVATKRAAFEELGKSYQHAKIYQEVIERFNELEAAFQSRADALANALDGFGRVDAYEGKVDDLLGWLSELATKYARPVELKTYTQITEATKQTDADKQQLEEKKKELSTLRDELQTIQSQIRYTTPQGKHPDDLTKKLGQLEIVLQGHLANIALAQKQLDDAPPPPYTVPTDNFASSTSATALFQDTPFSHDFVVIPKIEYLSRFPQTGPTRYFRLVWQGDRNKVIDASNFKINGSSVQLWDWSGKDHQIWWYSHQRQLVNKGTGLVLDVPGPGDWRKDVHMWQAHAQPNQKWKLINKRLVCENPNGYILTPRGITNGSKFRVVNGDQPNQFFSVEPV